MLRSRRGNAALAVTSAIRGEDNRLAILKRRSKQQQSVTNLAGSAGPNGVTNYQGWALPHQVAAKFAEKLVKKLLLAATLNAAFATVALAQTSSSIPPRDPPFGKGIPDSDSSRQPGITAAASQNTYPVPSRDPPFGKGILDNNTEREPSRFSSSEESIPRDPPFGKGELRNDAQHLPNSAATQGEAAKSAKKEARTKSALKKDSTPKSDTN